MVRVAERLGAPLLTTYSAAGIGLAHPLHPGLPPHVEEVGALWDEADLVLAVGSDLDGMMTQNWRMPAPAALVAVNVDDADAAKNYAPDVILRGDALDVCGALLRELGAAREPWTDVAAVRERALSRLRTRFPDELEFVDAFAAGAGDDAVVLCDMCIPGYWLGGFRAVAAPRRLAYPLGWGTLGCAFPQALGASLAGAGPVVSVSGDGGFLFACGELATAAQERLPLTAVIVDDGGYGMLRFDQRRAGAENYGVDLRRRTSPPWPRASACAPRPSTVSATCSRRRWRATSPIRSRACSSPEPRSSRRRRRRLVGTARRAETRIRTFRRFTCDFRAGVPSYRTYPPRDDTGNATPQVPGCRTKCRRTRRRPSAPEQGRASSGDGGVAARRSLGTGPSPRRPRKRTTAPLERGRRQPNRRVLAAGARPPVAVRRWRARPPSGRARSAGAGRSSRGCG